MKIFLLVAVVNLSIFQSYSQNIKAENVPLVVRSALQQKYPAVRHVTWEKEKGNFEANWGGRSGEDTSVQFDPSGNFIEFSKSIPANKLPAATLAYIKNHFKGAKVSEATKITNASGKISYEAEVNRKDLLFDSEGKFLRTE